MYVQPLLDDWSSHCLPVPWRARSAFRTGQSSLGGPSPPTRNVRQCVEYGIRDSRCKYNVNDGLGFWRRIGVPGGPGTWQLLGVQVGDVVLNVKDETQKRKKKVSRDVWSGDDVVQCTCLLIKVPQWKGRHENPMSNWSWRGQSTTLTIPQKASAGESESAETFQHDLGLLTKIQSPLPPSAPNRIASHAPEPECLTFLDSLCACGYPGY